MTLVLSRKDGDTVEITHGGETLLITLDKRNGNRTKMVFEGPRSFAIARGEMQRPKPFQQGEKGDSCFVQVEVDGASMQAEIIAYESRQDRDYYTVKLANGEVRKSIPESQIQFVEKENGDSFENQRPESGR